jgi:sec-independent protein translocase protein TatB
MFGMGGSEILVILIVALLFLGPDKLPEAAKTISKGIRDLKKQTRVLQNQIENDEHIGGAIRDLKSALRGDELPVRPPVRNTIEAPKPAVTDKPEELAKAEEAATEPPQLTLPMTAGEPDPDVAGDASGAELADLVKPAPGTVAKGTGDGEPTPDPVKQKHG